MAISYPPEKAFELRVKDTDTLDQFDVFVNGTLRSHVADGNIHAYAIERKAGQVMAIAVHFLGTDGGRTAVIDITDPNNPVVLASQNGLIHSYLVQA